jgi:hypothetical protein
MRLASAEDLAPACARFAELRPQLIGRYHVELADHPIAGPSLRHYLLLTERPELVAGLRLSDSEWRWSRYYWLARFAREWQAVAGEDAGLEQMVFQLLEQMDDLEPAEAVMAAVDRDAVIRPSE